MELKKELTAMAMNAKRACGSLLGLSSDTKNRVLRDMASALQIKSDVLLKANKKDLAQAKYWLSWAGLWKQETALSLQAVGR